jgi:hypothetical protein
MTVLVSSISGGVAPDATAWLIPPASGEGHTVADSGVSAGGPVCAGSPASTHAAMTGDAGRGVQAGGSSALGSPATYPDFGVADAA